MPLNDSFKKLFRNLPKKSKTACIKTQFKRDNIFS